MFETRHEVFLDLEKMHAGALPFILAWDTEYVIGEGPYAAYQFLVFDFFEMRPPGIASKEALFGS